MTKALYLLTQEYEHKYWPLLRHASLLLCLLLQETHNWDMGGIILGDSNS